MRADKPNLENEGNSKYFGRMLYNIQQALVQIIKEFLIGNHYIINPIKDVWQSGFLNLTF